MNLTKFIKNEISGWKRWEVWWLLGSCLVIAALSLYWKDSLMGIVSATTGIAYVVCAGKGKLSAYVFGVVNCVLYAIISYKAALYGETMLNAIYYLPMQFVGFYAWSKNMSDDTGEVLKLKMTWSQRTATYMAIMAGTLAYGFMLKVLGDAMPMIDSFTTVTSVVAMIISVKRYAEQWILWIVVDAVSVYMWWCDFRSGSDNMATLLMWIVYLMSGVVMLVKWEKEARVGEGV